MDYIHYSTPSIDSADLEAVREVLTSGWLTQGPVIPRFESEFARLHDTAHAVAVSSATAGLHISCLALGVGPGMRVWTSPNSFVASANCALYCGAGVDFVDIDSTTRNMSVVALAEKLRHAEKSGALPEVVIPVHFAGLPCDLEPMRALADRYGFRIIEDASHAVGARYRGRPVGSRLADLSVFSFHPVKIITSGEGGMVTTQDDELARRLRLLRSHGITRDVIRQPEANEGPWYYEQQSLGFNYRLTDIHAALGLSQLARLGAFHKERQRLAERYDSLLAGWPLRLPARVDYASSSWHLYVVEIEPRPDVSSRAAAFARLYGNGIGVNVHYIPIHLQPYYRKMGFAPGQFPNAEQYYRGAMSIPLHPGLSEAQQDRVVAELKTALVQ